MTTLDGLLAIGCAVAVAVAVFGYVMGWRAYFGPWERELAEREAELDALDAEDERRRTCTPPARRGPHR